MYFLVSQGQEVHCILHSPCKDRNLWTALSGFLFIWPNCITERLDTYLSSRWPITLICGVCRDAGHNARGNRKRENHPRRNRSSHIGSKGMFPGRPDSTFRTQIRLPYPEVGEHRTDRVKPIGAVARVRVKLRRQWRIIAAQRDTIHCLHKLNVISWASQIP